MSLNIGPIGSGFSQEFIFSLRCATSCKILLENEIVRDREFGFVKKTQNFLRMGRRNIHSPQEYPHAFSKYSKFGHTVSGTSCWFTVFRWQMLVSGSQSTDLQPSRASHSLLHCSRVTSSKCLIKL